MRESGPNDNLIIIDIRNLNVSIIDFTIGINLSYY